MSNEPRNDIDTTGLPAAVAGAITILQTALLSGGNNSVAFAAGQTLGELVAALQRFPITIPDYFTVALEPEA